MADGETVIAITISSRLSGTYQSATIAAEDFAGKVFVIDSYNATIGEGILVKYALLLKDQGEHFETVLLVNGVAKLE